MVNDDMYRPANIKKLPELPKSVIKSTINHALSFVNKPIDKLDVLDVGSGKGTYSRYLAKRVKKVVAVEPYLPAHQIAVKKNRFKNSFYYNCLIENYKTSEKFDLAICLTTLEHMPDSVSSFKKIFKLLKSNGVVYITAPNKLWPCEPHYHLWFLSYLPLPLANIYLKLLLYISYQ